MILPKSSQSRPISEEDPPMDASAALDPTSDDLATLLDGLGPFGSTPTFTPLEHRVIAGHPVSMTGEQLDLLLTTLRLFTAARNCFFGQSDPSKFPPEKTFGLSLQKVAELFGRAIGEDELKRGFSLSGWTGLVQSISDIIAPNRDALELIKLDISPLVREHFRRLLDRESESSRRQYLLGWRGILKVAAAIGSGDVTRESLTA
jgi:hypothetical protein